MQKDIDVITLGVAVMDILVKPVPQNLFDVDNTPVGRIDFLPGGDALNQAAALAGLNKKVYISCKTGDDAMADTLSEFLKSRNIGVSMVVRDGSTQTGTAVVLIRQDGQRNIMHARGSNYCFGLCDVDMDMIKRARALSIASIFGIPKLEEEGLKDILKAACDNQVTVFADMGSDKYNKGLKYIKTLLPYIDWFMPSSAESRLLTNENDPAAAAAVLKRSGAKNIIIKLGAKGAYIDSGQKRGYVSAYDILPVDTTGAGDHFCAGFIFAVLQGYNIKKALDFASATAAFSAGFFGACSARITDKKISAFMRDTPKKGE